MNNFIPINEIKIDNNLFNFVNTEILPGIDIQQDQFWKNFSTIIQELDPINKTLLEKRKNLQLKLDNWHETNKGKEIDIHEYKQFLSDINYLVEEKEDFKINTENVDDEIANISGPQLVVPITNARYALNAVNARWGSLYDALYGTNVIDETTETSQYDPKRGLKVIEYAKDHLDKITPLKDSLWKEITKIKIEDKKIKFFYSDKSFTTLVNENQIIGVRYKNQYEIKELILLKNNLHIRVLIDPNHQIGKNDSANISDILIESAISTILDCEDSVATVDADDKIVSYRNWLGLMKGDLKSEFLKNKKLVNRTLNKDIEYVSLSGEKKFLKSRSLMLIRNVGHLMTTPAILNNDNQEIGEGLMDAIITSLIALHDIKKQDGMINSLKKSIYIVKPKMHGPEEVEFTVSLFDKTEKLLNLKKNTIKIGIMDEERRTSINLKECIRAAKSRVAFINTGFLDRTGDEIHTSMFAGPFVTKGEMKNSNWIKAYESRNVSIGLKCGLQGKAQIGKGMWAMPDLMKEMIAQKINHLKAGANCAWVPSPTAATLHALHYHHLNITDVQNDIINKEENNTIEDLITLPLLNRQNLSEEKINAEIENNVQGILGYVVRWVDQGIGCSKVPDINNIGLMEDRATCRISSQALANWLKHEIISEKQVEDALMKMSKIVDKQNIRDPNYKSMSENFNSLSFNAVKELIFEGINQPSGYTEPILHEKRLKYKKING
ncbi:malate synthase G [Alphaproteobacteria bacterium]|nr:malate synthase G [Alphaproteobacteria bacterium]